MIETLKSMVEDLKERLKTAWAEQQESALFVETKERFEQLNPLAQKAIIYGSLGFLVALILWWPISNILDSSDFNTKFEENRSALKELLRIERDVASQPNVPIPMPPSAMRAQLDAKVTAAGIKPDQIKAAAIEMPIQNVAGADQRGVQYIFDRITIRQALDLAYELEHTDPSLRMQALEFIANPQDNHFYQVLVRLVNFAPRAAELNIPGNEIGEAVKKKGGGPTKNADETINNGGSNDPGGGTGGIKLPPPPISPPGAPAGQAPSIPNVAPRRGGA